MTASSIAFMMTAPAQTTTMSVFVDPLIASLGVSRSAVSTAYLVGTLGCAMLVPFLGRTIDRYGLRRATGAIALCFGVILIASSVATDIVGLTVAFVGIRVSGQGALQLAATTIVAAYLHERRGLGIGISSAFGAAGISLAPVLVERLVSAWGWRTVWIIEGVSVVTLVVPAVLLLLPRRPAKGTAVGVPPARRPAEFEDWTLRRTLRTGMFWVVTGGVAIVALVAAALHFHQVSVLGERGLTQSEAAATFLPQTIAGLLTTLVAGWLADRLSARVLLALTMIFVVLGIIGAGWLSRGPTVVVYSLAIGAAANGIRAIEAAVFARHFGTVHLGAIRGTVHGITVGVSAFGPLMLALGRELAESYQPVLLITALLPLAVAIAAFVVRTPERAEPNPRDLTQQEESTDREDVR
ncbi:MFS transporter [Sphaerimonospora mesophila]|uniref:MFS transporter n=1 Tax=Sphaerimonospora mesophila TaxID=37483 RepID=UPI0006E3783C